MFRPCAGIFPTGRCFFPSTHFSISCGRLAVCLLEDAAVPLQQLQHSTFLSFPTSCGCLAVCLLEDTVSASPTHPHLSSRLWWMPGSMLNGGRCLSQLITAHTLPTSCRWPTVTSLEDAVSTSTLLTWSRASWLLADCQVTPSPLVRQRPSLWDEHCSGSCCSPSARQRPSSWDERRSGPPAC
jgi:hypothetical protein